MAGLAAIVVVGAYMGKRKMTIYISFHWEFFMSISNINLFYRYHSDYWVGRDHLLENCGGAFISKDKNKVSKSGFAPGYWLF